jgi:NADH-ubiquinone oxidoreductase chain 1
VWGCWLVTILAESNRTPFDFAEGESELVSGFNIEYGSGGFAVLFLAEYGIIIFMSFLMCFLFLGGRINFLFFSFRGRLISLWYIWVRGRLPRFRYDKLIYVV